MYICPTCGRECSEAEIAKHFLKCWKEKNPNHKSVAAPRGEDIVTKQVDEGVLNFFNRLKGN